MFSSEHIRNEVLIITSEHPYSEDHFERKFKSNISPSDQIFEKVLKVYHVLYNNSAGGENYVQIPTYRII